MPENRKFPDFVYQDKDLLDVLAWAKVNAQEEFKQFVDLITSKWVCDIPKGCEDVPAVVNEFQTMGGNSFANKSRGYGVAYRGIVGDVASKLGVASTNQDAIADIEWRIVEHLVQEAEKKMSSKEREEFYEEARRISGNQDIRTVAEIFAVQGGYQVARIVLSIILRQILFQVGVRVGASTVLGRMLAVLAGPIGWVLGGLLLIKDLSDPSYSVTIPGVLLVCLMRSKQASEKVATELGRQL